MLMGMESHKWETISELSEMQSHEWGDIFEVLFEG